MAENRLVDVKVDMEDLRVLACDRAENVIEHMEADDLLSAMGHLYWCCYYISTMMQARALNPGAVADSVKGKSVEEVCKDIFGEDYKPGKGLYEE